MTPSSGFHKLAGATLAATVLTTAMATAAPASASTATVASRATVLNNMQLQCSRFTQRCRWVQTNPPYNPTVGTRWNYSKQWVWIWF